MYVCQSVSWLTSLLILDKSSDISSSGWDIFVKFFGDIPKMFLHCFQMLTNFLHVCQSIHWLISLLIFCHYRDISCSGWDNFMLVDLLPYWNYTNTRIYPVLNETFLKTFWRHSLDIGALFPNNCEFLVCLSVCYLAYFFTDIRQE